MYITKPKPLLKNSTIGLICPSWGFDDYKPINHVIVYLTKLGFKVKLGKFLQIKSPHYKYLSKHDKHKIDDFISFWNDDEIDAVFCLRGGCGALRLLKLLDKSKLKNTRKIFLGFSDITVLLLYIYSRFNLITFHGPLLGVDFLKKDFTPKDKSQAFNLWGLLCSSKLAFSYSSKKEGGIIYGGKAKGKLLGGNLTSICSMLGTKRSYLPSFKNSILFLEDYDEEPYRIDRLLTQLENAGIFSEVKGILFCSFEKCGFKNKREVLNLLKEKVKKYTVPTIYGFPVGHGKRNYTLPIGMEVLLDADNLTLRSV